MAVEQITNPALQYFGAKWTLADWVISHLPTHKAYVEVFGGSAAILLNKPPVKVEIYNDLNSDLVNFFRVLRNQPDELIHLLTYTPFSREEFDQCADWQVDNEVERARRFYVRSWQGRGFNGEVNGKNTWRSRSTQDKLEILAWFKPENLTAIASRLRYVQIEHIDALELIRKHDANNVLFYVDPPYMLNTRSSDRYAVDATNDFQAELADVLNMCQSKVVLSGYQCPEYDEWYKDWLRIERKVQTLANNRFTDRGTAIECLWLNSAAQAHTQQQRLFT